MSKMFVSVSVIYYYPTFVFYVRCFTNQSYKLPATTTTKNYLTDFLKILCISSFIDETLGYMDAFSLSRYKN